MEKILSYTLKRSKRTRRVRLAVHPDGSVVVTSPYGVDKLVIEKFIKAKSHWLWQKIKFFNDRQPAHKPSRVFTLQDYKDNKKQALRLVEERLAFYNQMLRLSYNKIGIRNQKSRWGSCSSKKNLNFNYKILFLTPDQQNYIIVHELCHLQEMNHSKNFWLLVARLIPDYKEVRKGLRSYRLF